MPIYSPDVLNDPEAQWAHLAEAVAPSDRERLRIAYHLAGRVHAEQYRRVTEGAEPTAYIVHPLRVARIVAEEWNCRERHVLITCLLHDVVEDCPDTLRASIHQEIERIEGKEICDAVYALTKPRLPEPCPPDIKAARDARYFQVLFHVPAWVRLIKCADRVDNLRDARLWGNRTFWERYSSETIGWHLYLARETMPIVEVALFKALVEGERDLRGRVPCWADGHLIDPRAAALIPEHICRLYGAIGLAMRGELLIVGIRQDAPESARAAVRSVMLGRQTACKTVEFLPITADAVQDALAAGLYGTLNLSNGEG
jgi:hypothetical protein